MDGHAGSLAVRTWPHPNPRLRAALLPDLGDHLGRYDRVAAALGAAGAEVVGHDPAGHGESAGERALVADFEDHVADLAAVLAVAGDGPVVLVGHGIGGAVAARFAQHHPGSVAALVLAAPALGPWPALDLLSDNDFPPLDAEALTTDPAERTSWEADPLVWHGGYRRATLAAADEFLRAIDFDHPLGDELPALWLHGDADEVTPLADTRAGTDRIRGLNFTERLYLGTRHDLWHERATPEVLADLTAFVAGL